MAPTVTPAAPGPAVYALPGALDDVPVFNSDRPETVNQDGILLSSFPGDPEANLDLPLSGRFGLFSHHVAHMAPGHPGALHIGLLARNPGSASVTLERLSGAAYLARPDAPFLTLAPLVADMAGTVYAGPGDRVACDLLHGRNPQGDARTVIAPGATVLLDDAAVPVTVDGAAAANERSTIADYQADGPVRLAEVALFAADTQTLGEADFEGVLAKGSLAGPADADATPFAPNTTAPAGAFRYGRVAGVSVGERWTGTLFGGAGTPTMPGPGQAVAFPIASLYLNTLGTAQIQSATLTKRLPGSAYQAHGNYGVTYDLGLPLDNSGDAACTVTLTFSSPLKSAPTGSQGIRYAAGSGQVTFRGPLHLTWSTPQAGKQELYEHVVLHQGECPAPFATLSVPAHGHVDARLTLIYPADCTPPQLLTVARS